MGTLTNGNKTDPNGHHLPEQSSLPVFRRFDNPASGTFPRICHHIGKKILLIVTVIIGLANGRMDFIEHCRIRNGIGQERRNPLQPFGFGTVLDILITVVRRTIRRLFARNIDNSRGRQKQGRQDKNSSLLHNTLHSKFVHKYAFADKIIKTGREKTSEKEKETWGERNYIILEINMRLRLSS